VPTCQAFCRITSQRWLYDELAEEDDRDGWPWRMLPLPAGLVIMAGCGGGGSNSTSGSSTLGSTNSSSGSGSSISSSEVNNVQAIQVNLGPANNVANGIYAPVTICAPGSSTNCQTIPDLLVDTGSEGVRILASQTNLSLPQVVDGNGNPIGNCVTFADNSYVWGPVATADVQVAGEKASSVPIQIIGASNFPAVPSACNRGGTADNSVSALGANGILGIGVFRQDCGPACTGNGSGVPKVYFSCPNSGCSVVSMPLQNQLQNPVWLFPHDNNGLLITLPSVTLNGAPSVSGSLIFGIGTQSNNGLGTAQVYATDSKGNFSTTFNGNTYTGSFLDTGSTGLFFLNATTIGLPACSDGESSYSCPAYPVSYSATNTGSNGASGRVSFSVANATSLFSTGNAAFNNLGGPDTGEFDWGLPFFFGRSVFVGIEAQNTPGGQGPYWAY